MAVGDEQRLITQTSQRQFELYALSLERGPNFEPAQIFGSYQAGRDTASGCILLDPERETFTTLALPRRVNHRWVRVGEGGPYSTPEVALDQLSLSLRAGEPPEPLPPGARRRPLLLKTGPRGRSPEFDLLTSTISHFPALMAVGECYLALPNPDANFVTDLQTNNFASRLFELYLLACFREQGLSVRQDHVSPDFLIEKDTTGPGLFNRLAAAWPRAAAVVDARSRKSGGDTPESAALAADAGVRIVLTGVARPFRSKRRPGFTLIFDDACLDLLTRDFIPCDSAHEIRLARWLACRRRRFRKPLTASEWNGRVADFELLDVGADPVPLEVYGLADATYLAAKAEKIAMYRRSGRRFWHWNAGGDAPQSLREAVKTLPPPNA